MAKNKYGGIRDIDNTDKRVYALWYGMLRRCYDKEQQQRNRGKSYAECSVCDRWMTYSNFAKDITLLLGYEDWLNKTGYCLDKDTINPGNKVYSRKNCCFIPYAENVRDIHRRKPQNIARLQEQRKAKYALMRDDKIFLFNSEKEACEFLGVKQCVVASCYRSRCKCSHRLRLCYSQKESRSHFSQLCNILRELLSGNHYLMILP